MERTARGLSFGGISCHGGNFNFPAIAIAAQPTNWPGQFIKAFIKAEEAEEENPPLRKNRKATVPGSDPATVDYEAATGFFSALSANAEAVEVCGGLENSKAPSSRGAHFRLRMSRK